MKRRLVITSCLLAILGTAAGVASAESPVQTHAHGVCIVIANSTDYGDGHYICVNP